jgi:hypothetical protein
MASFCTLIYNLTPQYRIQGTPLGAGDGTFTLPSGRVVLRVAANGSSQPTAGGTVSLLHWWINNEFTQGGFVTVTTNDNSFAATCNGSLTPAPWGETMAPFTSPPANCAYTDTTSTMATGTYAAGGVMWNACTRHANYGTNDYVPANTSVSTGPGCVRDSRSAGIITCSGALCGAGGLAQGQNLEQSMANMPLEPFTFTNNGQNVSMPFIAVPNSAPGRTSIQFTGVRPAGAAGGTCVLPAP